MSLSCQREIWQNLCSSVKSVVAAVWLGIEEYRLRVRMAKGRLNSLLTRLNHTQLSAFGTLMVVLQASRLWTLGHLRMKTKCKEE